VNRHAANSVPGSRNRIAVSFSTSVWDFAMAIRQPTGMRSLRRDLYGHEYGINSLSNSASNEVSDGARRVSASEPKPPLCPVKPEPSGWARLSRKADVGRRNRGLRFVYRRTGPSLLVVEGRLNTKAQALVSRSKTGPGKVTAPIFLLVSQVKLPKRLDLARDADRALDSVPGLIVANWVEGRIGK